MLLLRSMLFAAPLLYCCCVLRAGELPPVRVPDCLGVNIHFDDPLPGEMKMIRDGGFRIVRADLLWDQVEVKKGEYEWSRFDRLLDACQGNGIRVIMPLLYSNSHYDNNLSPHTDQGIAAFARYAAAAVTRYKGRGILWEMYNEPNNVFWRPQPDVNAYIKLAVAVGKAIKSATPDELYVGPALSGTDGAWLSACYKAGLLEYWDAVTVHPYGNAPPEERERHFRGSRALIDRYQPKGRPPVPLLSGEWGYTSAQFPPETQAKLLARQFLVNLSNGIGMSIWYDWRDDGVDPNNAEHRFGVVESASRKGDTPLTPKLAYLATKTLAKQLDGCTFVKRVALASKDDYLLVFADGKHELRGVAWTIAEKPHTITLPASAGTFTLTAFMGNALPQRGATAEGLTIELTDGPTYLLPAAPQSAWK